MKVYTCKGFDGHYPVGTTAIIVAHSRVQAEELLNAELLAQDLPPLSRQSNVTVVETPLDRPFCTILLNGDY